MTIILHHVGDANDPPVRVANTVRLAHRIPEARVLVTLPHAETDALKAALPGRVVVAPRVATDTLTEVTVTMRLVLAAGATTLLTSTEPGHVGRAALIARICYWRRGVRVMAAPSAPGTYRSPWRRTVIDAVRALVYRLTGWVW